MNPNRGSFPKSATPETPEQKRARFEQWMIDTADGDVPDPELAAILAQPGRDPSRQKIDYVYIVRARCWQCVAGNDDTGARERIEQCRTTSCALHAARPYLTAAEQEGKRIARRQRVHEYCRACQGEPRGGPTVAKAITGCSVVSCALWPARPTLSPADAGGVSLAPGN